MLNTNTWNSLSVSLIWIIGIYWIELLEIELLDHLTVCKQMTDV